MRPPPPSRPPYRGWLSVAALALGGCASTCGASSNPGTIGELGNGRFHFVCQGDSDPVCEFDTDQQFPDCVALGGSFGLEYTVLDNSIFDAGDINPVLRIESVSQRYFSGDDRFEAEQVGNAAFIVRHEDAVIDFLHLTIVEPDWIDVIGQQPDMPLTEVELRSGDSEEYRVFPRDTTCPAIGGLVSITAESSDEAVVSVTTTDVLQLRAIAPGQATVRVRLGEVEQAIAVSVDPPSNPPPTTDDSGTSGPDESTGTTGGSSGSDGDSTAGSGSTGDASGSSGSGSDSGGAR